MYFEADKYNTRSSRRSEPRQSMGLPLSTLLNGSCVMEGWMRYSHDCRFSCRGICGHAYVKRRAYPAPPFSPVCCGVPSHEERAQRRAQGRRPRRRARGGKGRGLSCADLGECRPGELLSVQTVRADLWAVLSLGHGLWHSTRDHVRSSNTPLARPRESSARLAVAHPGKRLRAHIVVEPAVVCL